jgi:hypothetical protein
MTLETLDCQNEPRRMVPRLPPNPKQAYGNKKVSLGLVPFSALIHFARAMMEGARKYGPFNWRKDPVESMTYIHAAMRHLACYADGERIDPESGVHHLGHVMACCGIVVDAEELGNLIDTRPTAGPAATMLRSFAQNQ